MSSDGGQKKKIAIIAVCSVILTAMVVSAVIGVILHKRHAARAPATGGGILTSSKSIKSICQPTDYKETCESSLTEAAGNTSDPKELIRIAFNVTAKSIGDVLKNCSVLQKAAKDPRINDAYQTCHELLNYSINDLQRSSDKMGAIDIGRLDTYVADVETWLTGAMTFQQTCLDGFENTTGDAAGKMKELLKTSGELTSNALAMITEISKIIKTLGLHGVSRRLLPKDQNVASGSYPWWVDSERRGLLLATPATIKPDVVVAQDGSGKYRSINEALVDIPGQGSRSFVIYIKSGIYKEYVELDGKMTNVVFIGDGPTKTKITGNRSFVGGFNTYKTATLAVNGERFMAKDIGIENTAGSEMHQAVALRLSSDMSIIYNCQIDGYQDTLYAHAHRQFYRDCTISGTIDFVFGNAASVFQNCRLVVRKPLPNQACMVTAQGRLEAREVTGIVLQSCFITGAPDLLSSKPPVRVFLGRPWKQFSRTIIMNSEIDGLIDPEGWAPWAGTIHLDTLWYAEYNNRGPGSVQTKRVNWKGLIKNVSPQQLAQFTPRNFIQGDSWIPTAAVPYEPGMSSQ